MRISDWSSDVCSSDLDFGFETAGSAAAFEAAYKLTRRGGTTITSGLPNPRVSFSLPLSQMVGEEREIRGSYLGSGVPAVDRSEEHTSELQSLMRISYAVFCLKKKKKRQE